MTDENAAERGRKPRRRAVANGVTLIAAERQRQIAEEGHDAKHDALHTGGAIGNAAAVYAMNDWARRFTLGRGVFAVSIGEVVWPDVDNWPFKPMPDDRVRELVKAGALVAAEIDRLLARQEAAGG